MKYKSFWINDEGILEVIDQRKLPHEYVVVPIPTVEDAIIAIKEMTIRGAGTIGHVAAIGMHMAVKECGGDLNCIKKMASDIRAARPTAVNLMWAVDRMMKTIENSSDPLNSSFAEAEKICEEDVERTASIGRHGYEIMKRIQQEKGGGTINVLTHCNAGWLGIINSGSALAPIYEAKSRGMDVHVWVDETRPRNQGANLTSYELSDGGVNHTVITDNMGGLLMNMGKVDLCIVGADRVTRSGDVANKIGTYLKALAAHDNGIPFYVAIPVSTFDFEITDGLKEIEIEERSQDEVKYISGLDKEGNRTDVLITPRDAKALNYGFDITPSRLVSGLITERGVCRADQKSIESNFSDLI